ncbi:MAG: EthD family reductase [Candidatus Pacebacteria bacterium]|nr:EthD family reductase [Candidatus Paceibacterota bacterium]
MAKMVVIYKTPKDSVAFEKHYFEVHVPLAKKLPGLKSYEASRGSVIKVAGDWIPYLVATLYFDDLDSIKKAFASPEGKACAADRKILAPNESDLQMYLFDDRLL